MNLFKARRFWYAALFLSILIKAACYQCAAESITGSEKQMDGEKGRLNTIVSLNGDWLFAYEREMAGRKMPSPPKDTDFTATMPVPGYWDDNVKRLQTCSFWGTAKFNSGFRHIEWPMGDVPPCGTLPYLIGIGYYKKTIEAPPQWKDRSVTLYVGGVMREAWVWLNGEYVGNHPMLSTAFELPLGKHLKAGASNELVIAVSNIRSDRWGCATRGFQGWSAGIYRPVYLKVSGKARIKNCYVRPLESNRKLRWNVEFDGDTEGLSLHWAVNDQQTGKTVLTGSTPVGGKTAAWTSETTGMKPWSDHEPNLYKLDLVLKSNEGIEDVHTQSFGLRSLVRDGIDLKLNGRYVMLRGGTDHFYFPLTCTAPLEIEPYREIIRRMKAVGFNWIRFHTWVPSEEYIQAADELGMMLQVEPPVYFDEAEWVDTLRACRKHPSVVIFCCGNEEYMDDAKIEVLKRWSVLCREHAPDALFSPMEAMRGVEYGHNFEQLGEGAVKEPFEYNPRRLTALKEFADVFEPYTSSLLSYSSSKCHIDWLNLRMGVYERPCLAHEMGIHGNYFNLDLEGRYEGTRIGTELFASVRKYLKENGLLEKAPLYYQNSCQWMRILRKHNLEMARRSPYIKGYDFLGPNDGNWIYCGYPSGIMNEFWELKPGETARDVLKYNGESVLLLNLTNDRNIMAGDKREFVISSSLYGGGPLSEGVLRWYLAGDQKNIFQRGEIVLKDVPNGRIHDLGKIEFTAPDIEKPVKLTLYVRLSGGEYEIENDWDFWVFPRAVPAVSAACDDVVLGRYGGRYPGLKQIKDASGTLRVLSALDADAVKFLQQGGRVVLLGKGPFPVLPTDFQMSVTGRVHGNLATVIWDHPLTRAFPHQGYCDWQFHSMLNGGSAVVFNDISIPFDPIIEIVSSFKLIKKQASLFEIKVGAGRLMVCTLTLGPDDPAAMYLLDTILAYAKGDGFQPKSSCKPQDLYQLLGVKFEQEDFVDTNRAYDASVHER